jgi:O-antigen/teichoic acid export membrane protein
VLINLYAIPQYGVIGAACATAFTEFFSFVGIYILFRRQTGIIIPVGIVVKPAAAAVVTLICCLVTKNYWAVSNHFLNVLIGGMLSSTTYALILVQLGGMPDEFRHALVGPLQKFRRSFR